MKRNMELIRTLLLEIEDHDGRDPFQLVPDEGGEYTNLEIQYHIKLMTEAGLVEAKSISSKDGPGHLIIGLTWQGHDFLDSARNDTIWSKAKDVAKDKGTQLSDLPISVVKGILISVGKQMFNIE